MTSTIILLGLGIAVATHTDRLTRAEIEYADKVLHIVASPLEVEWLLGLRPDAVSLVPLYSRHVIRADVYNSMADLIIDTASKVKRTAVVHYGHPTVASRVSQILLQRGRWGSEFTVVAKPAISSIDCLIADVGFDPSLEGVFVCDATLFSIGHSNIASPPSFASFTADWRSRGPVCALVYGGSCP